MGFGLKWLFYMEATFFSSSLSILVNGSSAGDFMASRGIRQGDMLSPFLFLLVAEGLARLMRNTCECGSFRGFHFKDLIHFEMLQFADDTVLICDGSWSNLWCIKAILRCFKFASGLCINLCKSSIFGLNLKDAFLDAASGVLTLEIRKVLFLFLDIPLGTNHRRKDTWYLVISKLRSRISSWNGKNLYLGGKGCGWSMQSLGGRGGLVSQERFL
ncbi:uncharacterized protein LOC131614677 [Vicia villosa]|uniref:uncharacterized protein LOC131614677 n=1 Tax=Vicia villosa TaxID=3911 RepID=UPI00273ABFCE|nr:uncharacterized protein LOC131614677 [Vicia villosa]